MRRQSAEWLWWVILAGTFIGTVAFAVLVAAGIREAVTPPPIEWKCPHDPPQPGDVCYDVEDHDNVTVWDPA